MEYKDFINLIKSDRFSYALLEVSGYAHYKHCEIRKITPSWLREGHYLITVTPSSNPSEEVTFVDTYKDSFKLFYLGRTKGKFTLKQIWDRIIIHEIK